MKKIAILFFGVLLLQSIPTGFFVLLNEKTYRVNGAYLVFTAMLLIYLVLYLIYGEKISLKLAVKEGLFNILFLLLWNVTTIAVGVFLFVLLEKEILYGGGGMLSSLEYTVGIPFVNILFSGVAIILKFLIWIYKKYGFGSKPTF